MARLSKLGAAQRLALQGKVREAREAYAALLPKETAAHAALAEIAAWRGDWSAALEQALIPLADPLSDGTYNVYSDMIRIAARAAAETGRWARLEETTVAALTRLADAGDDDGLADDLETLRDYARDADPAAGFLMPADDPEEAEFREALAEVDAGDGTQFGNAMERADHVYGLASVYEFPPGAVELYDRGEVLSGIFDNVEFLAVALAEAGRAVEAWDVIARGLPSWFPVEETQIAPILPITHPALAPLATPERCAAILATPRGDQG